MTTENELRRVISSRFKVYDKSMRDTWEAYKFIDESMKFVHKQYVERAAPPFVTSPLGTSRKKSVSVQDTLGAISHITRLVNPEQALVTAITLTENFLQDLYRLLLQTNNGQIIPQVETDKEAATRYIEMIVKASSREEMIEKLIEEKIMKLFYTNLYYEIFIKDKLKIGFSDKVKSSRIDITSLNELFMTRNLIIHNQRRVNERYVKEFPQSRSMLGKKLTIDDKYLKSGITMLIGVAATFTFCMCESQFGIHLTRGVVFDRYTYYLKNANRTIP